MYLSGEGFSQLMMVSVTACGPERSRGHIKPNFVDILC